MRIRIFALWVAMTLVPAAAWGAWFPVQVIERADGLRVYVDAAPSSMASMRVLLDLGSAADPVGKRGTAHLLARVLLSAGDASRKLGALAPRLHQVGATLRVQPGLTRLVVSVDAPKSSFGEAARLVLAHLSSPTIDSAFLAYEKTSLDVQRSDLSQGLSAGLIATALYRDATGARALGSSMTRSRIEASDLLALYRQRFRPGAVSIVVTGGASVPTVTGILDDAFLIPASEDAAPVSVLSPSLPTKVDAAVGPSRRVIGYRACGFDDPDAAACWVLGAALRRRLSNQLAQLDLPPRVEGGYVPVGADGYVAFAIHGGDPVTFLPRANQIFGKIASTVRPPLMRRVREDMRVRRAELRANPRRLADMYATLVAAGYRTRARLDALGWRVQKVRPPDVARVANKHLVPARRFTISTGGVR